MDQSHDNLLIIVQQAEILGEGKETDPTYAYA